MSENTPKKPHISASAIETYTTCGEVYRRRYIEKDVIPPGVALIRGSSFHSGAEFNNAQKVESFKDLPEDMVVERSVEEFDARIRADGVLMTDEEESQGKQKVLGRAKDEVVGLASLFCKEVAPEYQPTAVEEKRRIVLPSSSIM